MKRNIMFGVVVFLVLVGTVFAGFSREERQLINDCRLDCRDVRKSEISTCKEDYNECRNVCSAEYDECIQGQKDEYNLCKENCSLEFNPEETLDRYEQRTIKSELRRCNSKCYKSYRANKRNLCSINDCIKECSTYRKNCLKTSSNDYRNCRKNCIYTAFNDNITCGEYKAGDKFLEGCNTCECGYDSEIKCEQTNFCNFENVEVDEKLCVDSGGLYQQLCRGPYFRLRCSRNYYCQCGGNRNYECPENYVCITDFKDSTIPPSTDEGYKDDSGLQIGDIGICAEKIQLNNCGNGVCENSINEGETKFTCPEDCLSD